MKLSLISLLNEITGRTGPRTGIYEFHGMKELAEESLHKLLANRNKDVAFKQNIRDPRTGKNHSISFMVHFVPQLKFADGGLENYPDKEPIVHLNINSKNKDIATLLDRIQGVLEHELTHCFDFLSNNIEIDNPKLPREHPDYNNQYMNLRHEIRAWRHNLVKNMIKVAEMGAASSPEDLIKHSGALDFMSNEWKNRPDVQKMLRKAAFDVYQNFVVNKQAL